MTRMNLLKFFILISSAFVINSCKKNEFSRDTVISGEVIDQEGKPVEGFRVSLASDGKKTIPSTTHELGRFYISRQIPEGTSFLFLSLSGSDSIEVYEPASPNYRYISYEKDGKYELIKGAQLHIPRDQWGKSIELKFKLEKK